MEFGASEPKLSVPFHLQVDRQRLTNDDVIDPFIPMSYPVNSQNVLSSQVMSHHFSYHVLPSSFLYRSRERSANVELIMSRYSSNLVSPLANRWKETAGEKMYFYVKIDTTTGVMSGYDAS